MFTDELTLEIKYRSRYALLAFILKECINPKTKTDIFFTRKFSYTQLTRLIGTAVKLKLLTQQGKKYKTTPKGETYITKFEDLLKFLGSG